MKTNKPIIYLITEGKAEADNFREQKTHILEIIRTAVENRISHIQIREKKLSAGAVFELVSEAVKITFESDTKLLVNDRADIALAAKADGVHLTDSSLSVEIIRRSFPKNFIIGASTHSLAGAESAGKQNADFVTFSPVFDSPGKGEAKGLIELREVCEKLGNFPVVALGGINFENYESVLDAGAGGFAAIRFLNNAAHLEKLTRKFRISNAVDNIEF